MPELVILIGLQAAGKSTFRRNRFDATHEVVSKDLLRNNRRPQRRQIQLVEAALSAGRSVVVDNTNARRLDRRTLLEVGQAFTARSIGFYFSSRLEDSLRRNAERSGRERVPDVALFSTAKDFERPSRAEGFHELYFVQPIDGGFAVEPFLETSE